MIKKELALIILFFIYGLSVPILSNLAMILSLVLVIFLSRGPKLTFVSALVVVGYSVFILLHTSLYYMYGKSEVINSIISAMVLLFPCIIFLAEGEFRCPDDKSFLDIYFCHFDVEVDSKFLFLFFSAIGFFSFSFISIVYTYINSDIIDVAGRIMINPWNHSLINAPALGLYVLPLLLVFSYLYNISKSKSIIDTVIYMVIVSASIFLMSILQNRSGFIVLIACLISSILMSKSRSYLVLFLLFAIVLIIPYLIQSGILDAVLDRFKGDGLDSLRYSLWSEGIELAIKNPFGGFYESSKGFSDFHNAFIDVAKASGILPTVLLMLVILISVIFGCDNKLSAFVFSVLVIISLSFEPVYEASVWIFSYFVGCFIYMLFTRMERRNAF